MVETWTFHGGTAPVTADDAVRQLGERVTAGRLESWLSSSSGRSLAVVSNTERAVVMLLDGPGDPGAHASDPGADGWSDGFVLGNGQDDEYPDEDTVPLEEALRIVRHIVAEGGPPPDAAWRVDR
ncbi:hypothetical protein C5N14_02735 [Micromonospora sp. MW-13]|uniref:hypothetical protein n=1 Tax=Micromonospora sp. MW-13 TaxID=2094022 RepID=UPI000E4308B6|nr:hypothetical protein [Micromonospora sp. MW-13]RGC70376.1 hypothetical protein C5N14_02735 [Micromonospora sp. MW-13]